MSHSTNHHQRVIRMQSDIFWDRPWEHLRTSRPHWVEGRWPFLSLPSILGISRKVVECSETRKALCHKQEPFYLIVHSWIRSILWEGTYKIKAFLLCLDCSLWLSFPHCLSRQGRSIQQFCWRCDLGGELTQLRSAALHKVLDLLLQAWALSYSIRKVTVITVDKAMYVFFWASVSSSMELYKQNHS